MSSGIGLRLVIFSKGVTMVNDASSIAPKGFAKDIAGRKADLLSDRILATDAENFDGSTQTFCRADADQSQSLAYNLRRSQNIHSL